MESTFKTLGFKDEVIFNAMFTIGLRGKVSFTVISKTCKTLQRASNFSKNALGNEKFATRNSSKQEHDSNKIPSSDAITNSDDEHDFNDKLIKWAIKNNISCLAFSRLLKVLTENGVKDIPRSSQALLRAKENEIIVSSVPPGTYTHFGLKKNLTELIINLLKRNLFHETDINISIFIDQLLLVKLTQQSLWVILGSVAGFINNIFLIGVYRGHSRPKNPNLFLSEFVNEAKHLCTVGLKINNITYSVKIKRLICDAPAKAFVLNIKDFKGYSSCTKCNTVGVYKNNKICFPEKSTPRMDEDFEKDEMYQNIKTNLLEIPNFGIVSNVTIDYMHLVCLGVVHKLLTIWLKNEKYWTCEKSASDMIKCIAAVYPQEFSKKPKSLHIFPHWTGSNFRQFLLYYGPVVLKNNLREKYYSHFLLLHVACRILCIQASPENIDYGRNLLANFVENYKNLYKNEQITHNFHGLYHLADECASHGTLDSFSAFPFENFLLMLKNSVKKNRKKLFPQIILKESCNNIFLKSLNQLTKQKFGAFKKLKSDSDHKHQNCSHFEKLSFKNFNIIPSAEGDKLVFLKNGKIIEVASVLEIKENSGRALFIEGKEFSSVSNFHSEPFGLLKLKMFKVQHLSDDSKLWPVNMIDTKCMKIPSGEEEFVMIGLLDHQF